MTKAFELTDLVKRLKANGLQLAEKEAKDATVAILDWLSESLVLEGGVVGVVAAPVISILKPIVIKLEDKIDGVDGN